MPDVITRRQPQGRGVKTVWIVKAPAPPNSAYYYEDFEQGACLRIDTDCLGVIRIDLADYPDDPNRMCRARALRLKNVHSVARPALPEERDEH